jgi:hypothetical protein
MPMKPDMKSKEKSTMIMSRVGETGVKYD